MTKGRNDIGFEDPKLSLLNFRKNSKFEGKFSGEVNIQLSMHTQMKESNSDGENRYLSTLKLIIGENSDTFPFYCEIEMSGIFTRDINSTIDEESFANFNTAAILYSYARPIVSDTVSKSGFPPYNLPFMNFSEEDIEFIND